MSVGGVSTRTARLSAGDYSATLALNLVPSSAFTSILGLVPFFTLQVAVLLAKSTLQSSTPGTLANAPSTRGAQPLGQVMPPMDSEMVS